MSRVLVVGSANADLVVRTARRPLAGETLPGSELVVIPGGKGSNQAQAAARLGADVAFLGCVGRDGNGDLLHDALADAGVDVTGLGRVDAPTSVAVILVTPDGENSIIVCEGANSTVTPALLREREDAWRDVGLVVMQLEVPVETVAFMAAECGRRGVRFLLNAAPASTLDSEVLRACDPLVVNETEAALLLGADAADDPDRLLDGLLALGARSAVLTLGARGSVAVTDEGERIARAAEHVEHVVDTTGAGDAFVGGLATVLGRGGPLADGVDLGTRAAAISVQSLGAAASYGRLAELR
ncbi:MAG: ribokinase [Propionicimonas sp.]|uniref:ribokinase n=1 Tax=Propionicimonas sp. TaxID=1955623 RepID=UPI003D0FCCED